MAVTRPGWAAPDPAQTLPTVDAVRSQLGQGAGSTNTADLQRVLNAAIGHVEAACGPIASLPVVHYARQTSGTRTLVLPVMRLAQIVHLWDPDGTDVVDAVEARHVMWTEGILRAPTFVVGEWRAQVVVDRPTSAYSALYEATLIIAKHLWSTRHGLAGTSNAFGDPADATPGTGFAVPRRASTLMSPYKVVP